MKNIVILGGGFAGVRVAKKLHNLIDPKLVSVTLINKNAYQLFHPALYEVATSVEEITDMASLKKSITIPLEQVLKKTNTKLIIDEVQSIELSKKKVNLIDHKLTYDYLVCALGSVTDYYDIPGASDYSLPLKSLTDALMIRNEIAVTIEKHRWDISKKQIRIVIAGGGYTGCEFAAELARALEMIAWKNNYPLSKMEVLILEAADKLISGLDSRLSEDAYNRLKQLGVRVSLSAKIKNVTSAYLEIDSGDRISYDCLIWTAGVRAYPIPFDQELDSDNKGRLHTKTCLQTLGYGEVYALGDCACVFNQQGRALAPTAQFALDQADYTAYSIAQSLKGKTPKDFKDKHHGIVVTLGGKYASLVWGRWYFSGLLGYFARLAADFNYFRNVLGLWQGLRLILFDIKLFTRND